MNQIIEQLLQGSLSMDSFLEKLHNDQNLQEFLRKLLPGDAKDDPKHNFWTVFPYQSLQVNHFDFYEFLFWAVDGGIKCGMALNIFSRLSRVYKYHHPDVYCTNRYDEVYDIYLDAVKDCFDGPEVQAIVEQIIAESLELGSKAKRTKYAQTAIKAAFHCQNKKRPRWIQSPEWPMGSSSPMEFIAQKKVGDSVVYEFRDVETGDMNNVTQYY